MILPIVSVIVPTTHERSRYNERILNQFIKQDYEKKNILFDYNDGTIGAKRNRLCDQAYGEVILHMDSDDQYAPDWISKSVEALIESKADMCGLKTINMYDEEKREAWQYDYKNNLHPWVAIPAWICGATLCYWKKFWKTHPFHDINVSEDTVFVSRPGTIICAHDYIDGYLSTIHTGNTSPRELWYVRYRRMTTGEEEVIRKNFFAAEGSLTI